MIIDQTISLSGKVYQGKRCKVCNETTRDLITDSCVTCNRKKSMDADAEKTKRRRAIEEHQLRKRLAREYYDY